MSVACFDLMIEYDIVLGVLCLLFLFSIKYGRIVSVECVGAGSTDVDDFSMKYDNFFAVLPLIGSMAGW